MQAIRLDPTSPYGYERKYAALHTLQDYHGAVDASTHMFSLLEISSNPDVRGKSHFASYNCRCDLYRTELRRKYVPPSRSETIIDNVISMVFRTSPLVQIDVKSGRLCDGPKRRDTFKSELQFKELVSSMAERLDDERSEWWKNISNT